MISYLSESGRPTKGYKKILVGLDFSVTDKVVLAYVKLFNSLFKPEMIIFLNIHAEVKVPDSILTQYASIKEDINERYIEQIVAETAPLNLFDTKLKFLALEGDVLPKILKVCKEEEVDLLVVGKKDHRKVRHIVHKKLIRKAPCDVLIIPDDSELLLKKILVATDFSEHAELATEAAESLRKKTKAELILEHVYSVPKGYYKTGKSFIEFAGIMKDNAKESYNEFHSKMGLNGHCAVRFTLDEHDDTGRTLLESAINQKANIIISGSRGKSNLSSVLLGSVSESLVELDHQIPLLIVKKENEVFDFWKTFYGI